MDNSERDEDFTAFVVARSGRLVRIAHMLCGDPELAQDIVQSALEKAYLRWDRIELDDPFVYVRRAIINNHLSWRRRRWREVAVGGADDFDHEDRPDLGDHTLEIQHRAVVMAALGRLTPRERAVVVLRYVEDQSEAQTAAAVGVAVGTVKSTAARALAKLRAEAGLADIYLKGTT